jgi:ABC-type dipeptide transport system, periplasmic component
VPDGATHEALILHEDGTGPFMQEQFTPNAPVRILKKNPNYWDAGKPKAECLRITVAQEAVAAVSAIKSGQVDLVLNVDPSVIGALKDDPNVTLLQTAASNSMTVSMWIDTKPFDNPKVREALKAGVDRRRWSIRFCWAMARRVPTAPSRSPIRLPIRRRRRSRISPRPSSS